MPGLPDLTEHRLSPSVTESRCFMQSLLTVHLLTSLQLNLPFTCLQPKHYQKTSSRYALSRSYLEWQNQYLLIVFFFPTAKRVNLIPYSHGREQP